MGSWEEDLKKVPKSLNVKECYAKIYDWHKTYGQVEVNGGRKKNDTYVRAYLDFLEKIPPPEVASQEDMDLVFYEVISMLMEWSYHEIDDGGIKLAAYAYYAIEVRYGSGAFHNSEFQASVRKSSLYPAFGSTNWKGRYG